MENQLSIEQWAAVMAFLALFQSTVVAIKTIYAPPNFNVYRRTVTSSEMPFQKKIVPVVLVEGAISNTSLTPLNPLIFDVKIIEGKQWWFYLLLNRSSKWRTTERINTERPVIPFAHHSYSPPKEFVFLNDFYGSITKERALYFYSLNNIPEGHKERMEKNKPTYLMFVCRDVNNKTYRKVINTKIRRGISLNNSPKIYFKN